MRRDPNQGIGLGFALQAPERVRLDVYDIAGRLVRSLEESFAAGAQTIYWDGRDATGRTVSAGIYALHLRAGSMSLTAKAAWVR